MSPLEFDSWLVDWGLFTKMSWSFQGSRQLI